MIVRVNYQQLARDLTAIIEAANNRPLCWHCHGKGTCTCIACDTGPFWKIIPGPCVTCAYHKRQIINTHLDQLCRKYGVGPKLMQARIQACPKKDTETTDD